MTGKLSLPSGVKVEWPSLVVSWDGGFGPHEDWDFLHLSSTLGKRKVVRLHIHPCSGPILLGSLSIYKPKKVSKLGKILCSNKFAKLGSKNIWLC